MSIYYQDDTVTLLLGDTIEQMRTLPDGSVDCVVTSPPYFGLRDYGNPGQYGLEETPAAYVETMRQVFAEARRVLADDGTLWLNLGDSYATPVKGSGGGSGKSTLGKGCDGTNRMTPDGVERSQKRQRMEPRRLAPDRPTKNLLGIPWRTAFALQDDSWILRNEIIWSKPNAMPESARDRMSSKHEHLFMFAKQPRYWFDLDAIREPHAANERKSGARASRARGLSHHRTVAGEYAGPDTRGRNPGDIWEMATRPYPAAHFATFPMELPLRCIKAGCKPGGTVLDPFSGSGTTGAAARQLGRRYVGIDLNPAYHDLAKGRFTQGVLDFGEAS